MSSSFVKLFFIFCINHCFATLTLNGCDSTLWTESYYASSIFSLSNNSTHCMTIASGSIGNDNILPTLWFGIGLESNVYYNISYNISCNLIDSHSKNNFDVMFRVLSISKHNDTFEYNDNFHGYLFRSHCGENSHKISVSQYPNSEAMDTNHILNHHHFNLNNGETYNVEIIVGDKINKNPTHHQIYINNKLVLRFVDDTYLYGGIGITAYTQEKVEISTFYIDNFVAKGIGFEDYKQCEDIDKIKHINWMDLSRNSSLQPNMNHTINVNKFELTLHIKVELEYIGYSYGDRLQTYGYGTTYILDFQSFDAHHNMYGAINQPGICSNRMSESFQNKDFSEWWNYSLYPYLDNQINQIDEFLAYPKPSKYWNMYMKNSDCTPIVYEGIFDLNDLRDCKYLHFVNTDEWMNISGVFYINLVSPMNKDIDIGYYYVYQLLSSPFIMSIRKNVNILSSAGISLFTLTFVAVYKQNENELQYNLILLTESADYLFLTVNKLLDSPNPILQITETENDNCLQLRNNICSQLFEISAYPIQCANDIFSGQYGIRFNIICNPHLIELQHLSEIAKNLKLCNDWLDAEIENIEDNTVDLFVDIQFEDTICDTKIYLIEFTANMLFYIDNTFSHLQTDIRNGYEMGVDRVYVSILLGFNGAAYNILEANLINVWLCTIDEKYQNNNNFSIAQFGKYSGGCFATDLIDINQPYFIVQNGQVGVGYNDLNVIMYERDTALFQTNEVRFSFNIPTNIIRHTLYIHSELTIKLISNDTNTKTTRRILIENNAQDQVRHFMDHIRVIPMQQTHENNNVNKILLFLERINLKIILFVIIIAISIGAIIIILTGCANKIQRTINHTNSSINPYVTE